MSAKIKLSYENAPELLEVVARLGKMVDTVKKSVTPEGKNR